MTVQDILLTASEQGVYFYLKNDKLAYKAKKNSLTDELKSLIIKHQVEIKAYFLKAAERKLFELPPVSKVERTQPLKPSFAQQRLWFIDQLDGSLQYNIQGHMEWVGSFDLSIFEKALYRVIERHEVLRTHFSLVSGEPQQVILSDFSLPLTIHDISNDDVTKQTQSIKQIRESESVTPFDLNKDMMLRLHLVKISDTHHLVLYTMHHIASDGWSGGIFKRELRALYEAFNSGLPEPLPKLNIQYADFAHWQRNWLTGSVLEKHMDYWKTQLAELPLVHSLPLDKTRPKQQQYTGRAFNQVFDKKLTSAVRQACEHQGVTIFMLLETALAVLFARYSNEKDIVIGTPVAGRSHKNVEDLIGFFINTLVLRTDLKKYDRFSQLLKANKQTILDGYAYQHIPFEMLVEALSPERDLSYNSLFQILFVVQNTGNEVVDMPLEQMGINDEQQQKAISEVNIRFDLALHAVELKDTILLNWSYRDSLFEDDTVLRMASNFEVLLSALLNGLNADSEPLLDELDAIAPQEATKQLLDWNTTDEEFCFNGCLHEFIEQQVEKSPNAIAVIFNESEYTYKDLDRRANQLAHKLRSERVTLGSKVILSVDRSFEAMIGLLGILKSGAAYVPVDPSYPKQRLQFIFEDCQASCIVTSNKWLESLPVNNLNTICVDDKIIFSEGSDSVNYKTPKVDNLTPDADAYMIYTSGSTGKPKGVVVKHSSVVNFVNCGINAFMSNDITGSIVSSPLAFDATVQSLFIPLCVGKYVELIAEDERFLENLADYIVDDEDALLFKITPTHLKALSSQTFVDVNPLVRHTIVIAGEPLTHEIIEPWLKRLPNAKFINEYGPTEATVGSCIYEVHRQGDFSQYASIPIGRPFSNVKFYILNSHLQPQPIGSPGELYIGGAGLAKEYFNQPELTANKFIVNPFSSDQKDRLYRTGDLVKYLPDGNVVFLGRIDHQVKIRGFRIELGEIESSLLSHADVESAVVTAVSDDLGNTRLIAYVVLATGNTDESQRSSEYSNTLKTYLAESLPDYMLPNQLVFLDQLPETPNGKVDREALPHPSVGYDANDRYIEPKNVIEKLLVQIWSELLSLPQDSISTSDNFFALGGHSLLVMQLISQLQKNGYSVKVKTVMKSATLAELASKVVIKEENAKQYPNLIPHDCSHILPEHLNLVNLSEFEIAQVVSRVPGGAANIQDIYPLAPLQEGILYHHLISSEKDPYLLDKVFVVARREQVDKLIQALQQVIDRHDVLRTAIITEGLSDPVQVVLKKVELPVSYLTLISDEALQSNPMAIKDKMSPMLLTQAPLIRVQVAAVGDRTPFYFHLQSHHIISDHVGNDILWSEVEAIIAGESNRLPNPAPYREFVAQVINSENETKAKEHFSAELGDISEPCLAFGLNDVSGRVESVDRAYKILSSSMSQKVRAVGRKLRMSPASLFHAAWAIVVGRCSGTDNVVFGTALSGRLQGTKGADRMLGLFLNTLPVRFSLKNCTVSQLAKSADQSLKALLSFEQSSLVFAQSCSGVSNDLPLFNTLLNYRHTKINKQTAEKVGIQGVGGGEGRNNYPISIAVSDWGEGFGIKATTDKSVGAERLAMYLESTLQSLITSLDNNEKRQVNSISIVPETELNKLLACWNDTQVDFPIIKTVHHLFETQVEKNHNEIAIIYKDVNLTYGELNERSNQLAHYLVSNGIQKENVVGIATERSLETMIGLFAILKAGATYVPIDVSYPKARVEYILSDSNAKLLLTTSRSKNLFRFFKNEMLVLDELAAPWESCNRENLEIEGLSEDCAAYIIYTSGSTGTPKGVVVDHKSVVNFLQFGEACFLNEKTNSAVVSSSLAFDATVQSLYVPLSAGKSVTLLSEGETMIEELVQCVANEDVCYLFKLTPTHLNALSSHPSMPRGVLTNVNHTFVVAGEALTSNTLSYWFEKLPNAEFINEYGPTEATVGSSIFKVPKEFDFESSASIPIGKPLSNVQLYILDNNQNIQPIGAPGELYIGGAGLARGYLNKEELTRKSFIANPFSSNTSDKLYRTGDLVRYLPDGNIVFLGRIDEQVKLRGFRIELGEIECYLLKHAIVESCIVQVKRANENEKQLVAYLVINDTNTDPKEIPNNLRTFLKNKLPQYMIPDAYVVLKELPLTPNGKIDKKALPAVVIKDYGNVEYVEAKTETEILLVEIWRNILGIENNAVSIKSNFYELGGHSLLIIKMMSLLQKNGINCDVKLVVSNPVLQDLARELEHIKENSSSFNTPQNLIPDQCKNITPDMLPLVDLTQVEIDQIASQIKGGVENIKDIYPLAPLQEGILFHHLLAQENDPYVLGNLFMLNRQEDIKVRLAALQRVINRHDVLRTGIIFENLSTAVQVVGKNVELPVEFVTLPPENNHDDNVAFIRTHSSISDLTQAPLIRVIVASKDEDGPFYFYQQSHHIVSDHIASAQIRMEMEAIIYGQESSLPESRPYREFVAHVKRLNESLDTEQYFKSQLAEITEPTLPFGLKNVHGNGDNTSRAKIALPDQLSARIRKAARSLRLSPSAVFHAAWALVVGRTSGKKSVVFGTVFSGRLQGTAGADRMLGLFMNTLPLNIQLQGLSAKNLILETDKKLKELLKYEQVSLAKVQSYSGISNEQPLFSALLNYRHSHKSADNSNVSTINDVKNLGGDGKTNYPFELSVSDWGDDFSLYANVEQGIDSQKIIEYTVNAVSGLVELIEKADERSAETICILSPDDKQQNYLSNFRNDKKQVTAKGIHALIEKQIELLPQSIAVTFDDKHLSYAELGRKSNQIANQLINRGVTAEAKVGICLNQSIEVIISILGILKSGAAFVPIDPSYPQKSIAYIMNKSKLDAILVDESSIELFGEGAAEEKLNKLIASPPAIILARELMNQGESDLTPVNVNVNNLCYVIFTSGTSGNPKGTLVEHCALVSHIQSSVARYNLDRSDIILQFNSINFDASLEQIFNSLISGSKLVLRPVELWSSDEFPHWLRNQQISILDIVPSYAQQVISKLFQTMKTWQRNCIKHLIVGGEVFPPEIVKKWIAQDIYKKCHLYNVYGPTETCITSHVYQLSESNSFTKSIPIGFSLSDTRSLVLDDYFNLTPNLVPGELYIGGPRVARGYLEEPGLTSANFVPNPYAMVPGERLYKSGDLVRILPSGALEYLGRVDEQIKLRGYRIEPAEIEVCLNKSPLVEQAIVMLLSNDSKGDYLVAYCKLSMSSIDQKDELNKVRSDLAAHCLNNLPKHMNPSAIVIVSNFPLLPNGKINKKELPKPDVSDYEIVDFVAPSNEVEKIIVELCSELLEIEQSKVSLNSNFFALGGHSLLVMKLVSKLKEKDINVSVKMVFSADSLLELSREIIINNNIEEEFSAPPNLIPPNCKEITPEQLPLLNIEKDQIDYIASKIDGGMENIQDMYPLVPLQEGILFHHMLSPESDPYLGTRLFVLDNEQLVGEILKSVQLVIDRHDALRTAVVYKGIPQSVQVVQRKARLVVHEVDLSSTDDVERKAAENLSLLPNLVLTKAPLVRAVIGRTEKGGIAYFQLQSHHIISDHVGDEILWSEVAAILEGNQDTLPVPSGYREFVGHVMHKSKEYDAQAYFTQMLSSLTKPSLPFGLTNVQGSGQGLQRSHLDLELTFCSQLREVAKLCSMSPASIFHVAWGLVLSRLCDSDDIVFGTVLSGRLQGTKNVERMLGLFINTLPIRINASGKSIEALVKETDTSLRELINYEYASLAQAQKCSGVKGDLPLFSAILNYRHSSTSKATDSEYRSQSKVKTRGGGERTNYPIELSVTDRNDIFSLDTTVVSSVDPELLIEYMRTGLENIVHSLGIEHSISADSIDVVSEREYLRLTKQLNENQVLTTSTALVHQIIEQQAICNADSVAVTFGTNQLSYHALDERSNKFARLLMSQGVTPGSGVGILLKRNEDLLISLLAVLKIGCFYVPLDPSYPEKRLSYIIEDSGIEFIVSQNSLIESDENKLTTTQRLKSLEISLIDIADYRLYNGFSGERVSTPISSSNLCYVIYTSGTTGKPKGVSISHENATNFLYGMLKRPGINIRERLLAVTTLSFDISFLELFFPLIAGATVCVADKEIVSNGETLRHILSSQQITMLQATPMTWKMLLETGWLGNTKLTCLVGGEAFPHSLTRLASCVKSVWNMYGPTEATVWATCGQVISDGLITIGNSNDGVACYILDKAMRICPVGTVGQIYIGGKNVAQGYYSQSALTAENFIPNPLSESKGSRLYRTGDLARYTADGQIDILGRDDSQIKLRGFRIELKEIERVMCLHNEVKEAKVILSGTSEDNQKLVAFIIPIENHRTNSDKDSDNILYMDLIQHLKQFLPNYMVPLEIVNLEEFPTTENGKIDLKALSAFEGKQLDQIEFVPPKTETEQKIAEIWSEILEVPIEKIGLNDSFFKLGGHSLLAMKLVSQIDSRFNASVLLSEVFRLQKLSDLASHVDATLNSESGHQYEITHLSANESNEDNDVEEFEL